MNKPTEKAGIDPIEAAKKERARIVAETEEACALPCTPTQDELNQAMADLGQVSHVTIDEDEAEAKSKNATATKPTTYSTRASTAE